MTLRFALLILALAAAFVPPAEAQTARLGYLDPDIIIVQMPEHGQIRTQLQEQERQIAGALRAAEDSIRTEFQALQEFAQSAVATDAARQEREQSILRAQASLERRQQIGLQTLARREQELLSPLLERLQTAIDEEAAAQGLAMVFSARANNAPVLLYAGEGSVNLTEPVMRRLGLPIPTPGAAAGTGN